jgi:hypothetical protein
MELHTSGATTGFVATPHFFQHFMEPEGLLLHSQELSTCHYPSHTNSAHTTPYYLPLIHLNIIHPPVSWSF